MKDYSLVEKFLHWLALRNLWFAELTYDLEKRITSHQIAQPRVTYVTGLARSGTTILMRALYSSNVYASLTYNDMPFVMCPNIWSKITKFKRRMRFDVDRAHRDGIKVNYDSPEALEEVFWRTFCAKHYIHEECLTIHDVDSNTLKELMNYQKLVCLRYSKNRYLAKNNNFLLRLKSIDKLQQNFKFVIMFRDPINQSYSLHKQHLRFADSKEFTQKYMCWLAHFEFGPTHRPFKFFVSSNLRYSPDNVNYWLDRWIDAYSYVLSLLPNKNMFLVQYERLCSDKEYWNELLNFLDLDNIEPLFEEVKKDVDYSDFDSDMLNKAMEIYKRLSLLVV